MGVDFTAFRRVIFHWRVWGRQISWDRLSEGGGISCLLKCDRIVTEVKIKSITPFSLLLCAGIAPARLHSAGILCKDLHFLHKSTYSNHLVTM